MGQKILVKSISILLIATFVLSFNTIFAMYHPVEKTRSIEAANTDDVHIWIMYDKFGNNADLSLANTQSMKSKIEVMGYNVNLTYSQYDLSQYSNDDNVPMDLIIVEKWVRTNIIGPDEFEKISEDVPIIGIGYAGMNLYTDLGLAISDGATAGQNSPIRFFGDPNPLATTPYILETPVSVYSNNTGYDCIYSPWVDTSGQDVLFLAGSTVDSRKVPIAIEQNRYLYWGFDRPQIWSATGDKLFHNTIHFLIDDPLDGTQSSPSIVIDSFWITKYTSQLASLNTLVDYYNIVGEIELHYEFFNNSVSLEVFSMNFTANGNGSYMVSPMWSPRVNGTIDIILTASYGSITNDTSSLLWENAVMYAGKVLAFDTHISHDSDNDGNVDSVEVRVYYFYYNVLNTNVSAQLSVSGSRFLEQVNVTGNGNGMFAYFYRARSPSTYLFNITYYANGMAEDHLDFTIFLEALYGIHNLENNLASNLIDSSSKEYNFSLIMDYTESVIDQYTFVFYLLKYDIVDSHWVPFFAETKYFYPDSGQINSGSITTIFNFTVSENTEYLIDSQVSLSISGDEKRTFDILKTFEPNFPVPEITTNVLVDAQDTNTDGIDDLITSSVTYDYFDLSDQVVTFTISIDLLSNGGDWENIKTETTVATLNGSGVFEMELALEIIGPDPIESGEAVHEYRLLLNIQSGIDTIDREEEYRFQAVSIPTSTSISSDSTFITTTTPTISNTVDTTSSSNSKETTSESTSSNTISKIGSENTKNSDEVNTPGYRWSILTISLFNIILFRLQIRKRHKS